MIGTVEQEADDVACTQAFGNHVAGKAISGLVQLTVGERPLLAVDRQMAGGAGTLELVAALFEQVMQPLAFGPTDLIVAGWHQDEIGKIRTGFGDRLLK